MDKPNGEPRPKAAEYHDISELPQKVLDNMSNFVDLPRCSGARQLGWLSRFYHRRSEALNGEQTAEQMTEKIESAEQTALGPGFVWVGAGASLWSAVPTGVSGPRAGPRRGVNEARAGAVGHRGD